MAISDNFANSKLARLDAELLNKKFTGTTSDFFDLFAIFHLTLLIASILSTASARSITKGTITIPINGARKTDVATKIERSFLE